MSILVCQHPTVQIDAVVQSSPDVLEKLIATIRLHCPKCGMTWDVLRVPLDAKPSPP